MERQIYTVRWTWQTKRVRAITKREANDNNWSQAMGNTRSSLKKCLIRIQSDYDVIGSVILMAMEKRGEREYKRTHKMNRRAESAERNSVILLLSLFRSRLVEVHVCARTRESIGCCRCRHYCMTPHKLTQPTHKAHNISVLHMEPDCKSHT